MNPRLRALAPVLAASLLAPAAAVAQTAAPAPTPPPAAPNDYTRAETWLCRPGAADACAGDLSTTIVAANGKLSREAFKPAANPSVDCFYVYPTVSHDPTPNSDMVAGPEEKQVAVQQFARFASRCRTFAPLYRQVTLTALTAGMMGKPMAVDRDLGYHDVRDAWNEYLAKDNHGRGVVLIGHSQGSGVLTRLIREEIDGKPVQARLVSALLLGTSLAVPEGKDVGAAFKAIPLCRAEGQTGCAVAFASFRATSPPPANSRFGKVVGPGVAAACVNPAALAGGEAPLHSYFANRSIVVTDAAVAPPQWVKGGPPIATPFVSTPGLVSARCVADEHGSYLSVSLHADPADLRAGDIAGDVVIGKTVAKDWGLHLIDVNLVMGDLLSLVDRQSRAYAARR